MSAIYDVSSQFESSWSKWRRRKAYPAAAVWDCIIRSWRIPGGPKGDTGGQAYEKSVEEGSRHEWVPADHVGQLRGSGEYVSGVRHLVGEYSWPSELGEDCGLFGRLGQLSTRYLWFQLVLGQEKQVEVGAHVGEVEYMGHIRGPSEWANFRDELSTWARGYLTKGSRDVMIMSNPISCTTPSRPNPDPDEC